MVDTDARTAWQLFHVNWLPIAAMGSLLALGLAFTGLRLEPIAFGVTLAIAAVLLAVAYRHRMTKGELADPKLVFSIGTIGQVILTCAIVGPLSYVAAKMGWPLQDHALLAIDRALGMDPEPIARYVNDHPWLADGLSRCYGLIKWPLLGIPVVLALTARYVRLQLFVLAMNLALAITIAISAVVPAIGTYYGLQLAAAHFPDVNTAIYAGQLHDMLALRDGSLRELELFKLSGIVSFPSFHAASAVLYMWALWPVRGIGGIAAALNLLMIAATPVIGAHYMIDVFGGIALAAASILAAKLYLERFGRSPQASAPSAASPVWRPSLAE
ncbi:MULTISPECIES: phosphatase PAP2 family protein [unclassified Bradyrhizobium]|uniref:phosphatase PAP2 family protein n=1 Tax=unclassified Bradyrhizobium TaxID=2631580 RepID=UPI00247AC2B2|nr:MULTISPECIES: phosphatase PAP2 family protein [unclassified Bradyrhizobium]WGR70713.1 phosphatase PAP2 family protein [Bradyrhizobium sp. ISRA426]WGR75552.1 phosphatase PAP2 family protein [Bradyrhizobium sp. ISRA430]WGR85955.1 phosphatase PAP2 family protein [Bradyrhizobium sp. ISRA432]